jgi:hypothetical protein
MRTLPPRSHFYLSQRARGPLSQVDCNVRPAEIIALGWPRRPCATRMIERRSLTIASNQPAPIQG